MKELRDLKDLTIHDVQPTYMRSFGWKMLESPQNLAVVSSPPPLDLNRRRDG